MEPHQIVARHARHRLLRPGSRQRVAVRVIRAVQQLREHAQRHLHRLHLLALNAREPLPLLPLEIGLRERRMQDHVRENVERGIQVVFERGQRHARHIELRTRAELRAELRQRVADLQRRAAGRPFVEHVERETRRPRRGELIGRVPRVHQQRHVHLRDRMPLGEHDLETVGQRRPCHLRKPRVGRRAGGRQLGAVRPAGGDLVRRIRMHFDYKVAVTEPACGRTA